MIKKRGQQWILYNKEGTKILGHHPSQASALRQERAIHMNKSLRAFSDIIEKSLMYRQRTK